MHSVYLSDDGDYSDNPDNQVSDLRQLDNPMSKIHNAIIYNILPFNYLKICVNIIEEIENRMLKSTDFIYKIHLAVMVLDSMHPLDAMKHIHYSTIQTLYELAQSKKLNKIRKKRKKCKILRYLCMYY